MVVAALYISQFAGHFLFQHREKLRSTEHHIDKKVDIQV